MGDGDKVLALIAIVFVWHFSPSVETPQCAVFNNSILFIKKALVMVGSMHED